MAPETPTALQQTALLVQICFYAITAISIIAAGALGVLKYRLFRSGRPFLSVTLEATSRPSSPGHVQVGVIAKLHNGSKVLARADVLEWECRDLATYDDATIDEKIAEHFHSADGTARHESGKSEFPWNVRQRITKDRLGIQIEPNETGHDHVTFVVPRYCTAVQIRLFIPAAPDSSQGWTSVIYHDTNAMLEE